MTDIEWYNRILERMRTPTSNKDLMKMMNGKLKVMLYEELPRYDKIEEVLEPHDNVIILYPTGENIGHWTALFRYPKSDEISFFDPYGQFPDSQFEYVDKEAKIEPYLSDLLSKYKGEMEYNEYPFQKVGDEDYEINNCGIWCVNRLQNKNLNLKEYSKIYLEYPLSKNILPDIALCSLYI